MKTWTILYTRPNGTNDKVHSTNKDRTVKRLKDQGCTIISIMVAM